MTRLVIVYSYNKIIQITTFYNPNKQYEKVFFFFASPESEGTVATGLPKLDS